MKLSETVLQVAIGTFNALCGSLVGWFGGGLVVRLFYGRQGGRAHRVVLGLDRSQAMTLIVVACVLVALIWGKRIWRYIDRRVDRGWGGPS